jgi:hypothetical protein
LARVARKRSGLRADLDATPELADGRKTILLKSMKLKAEGRKPNAILHISSSNRLQRHSDRLQH